MAGKLTPFGKFFKWVLVPVIIASIGYFLVGPNLGKGALHRVPGLESYLPDAPSPEPPPSDAPKVDISVRPNE